MSLKTRKTIIKHAMMDIPDFFYRLATNQMHIPPYSLRMFVGGAEGFTAVGEWLLNDLKTTGVINQDTKRILDIGCGSGRLAYVMANDGDIRQQNIQYVGMDIDLQCVQWCQKKIHPLNPKFDFYEVDIKSNTYNPGGKYSDWDYKFPFEDHSFDLIILTSVFTHMLEKGIANYCSELQRLLSVNGTAYTTAFVYKTREEAIQGVSRRKNKFPAYHEHYALADEQFPENAIAYREDALLEIFERANLSFRLPTRYGLQDLYFLMRKPDPDSHLS